VRHKGKMSLAEDDIKSGKGVRLNNRRGEKRKRKLRKKKRVEIRTVSNHLSIVLTEHRGLGGGVDQKRKGGKLGKWAKKGTNWVIKKG